MLSDDLPVFIRLKIEIRATRLVMRSQSMNKTKKKTLNNKTENKM